MNLKALKEQVLTANLGGVGSMTIDAGKAAGLSAAPARQPFQVPPVAVHAGARQAMFGPGRIKKTRDRHRIGGVEFG